MAGKISLLINVLLAAAVIYLFTKVTNTAPDATPETPKEVTEEKSTYPSIAFVNNDSLSLNYKFRQDKSAVLDKATASLKSIENKIVKAQEDYYAIVNKAQSTGFASDDEMYAAEKKVAQLEKDMPYLQGQMEKSMGRLRKLEGEINDSLYAQKHDSLYARLYRFVDTYTEDKPIDVIMLYTKGITGLYSNESLDVTNEIVDGLNLEYEADQAKEEK